MRFPTFKLPLCVEDTQIRWYGVEAAAADHIHAFVQGFGVVLQLHTLQELRAKCMCMYVWNREEKQNRLIVVCWRERNQKRGIYSPTWGSPQMSK